MAKVLHSAAMFTPSRGQLAQMGWEYEAARRLGLSWDTVFFCPLGAAPASPVIRYADSVNAHDRSTLTRKLRAWPRFRREYYRWLEEVAPDYDALLLRYNFHDPYQWSFARRATRPLYFVHHTLEVPEMFSSRTLVGAARGIADWILGPPALRKAKGIIGVTDEIAQYECARAHAHGNLQVGTYPNGVEYTEPPVADVRTGAPSLLYVAGSFAVWHGLDKVVRALRLCADDFSLHLIGQLGEDYRQLIGDDRRFVIHGSMPRESIRSVASTCDAGLSSFALERNNMRQACTLKVRDYLTMGVPVYAGYEDVFGRDFPYFMRGPASAGPMLRYAKAMRCVSRDAVADAARPYIDKGAIMRRTLAFVDACLERGG